MASTNTLSTLKQRIETGEMLVIAELNPPKDANPDGLRAQAAALKGKVHAAGLLDNRDGVGMSPTAAASIVAAVGLEPIVHMVTRDRNRVALESDFIGARALGISNILCTTGTHQTLGTFKSAKNVFDVDSVQLLKLFSGHAAESGSTCLGATAAPFADPMELQLMRLAKKTRLGASFIITQPVFDTTRFGAWWKEVRKMDLAKKSAVIVGIRPLLTKEDAKAYAAERPSPRVPAELLERITGAADDAAARREGISAAAALAKELKALPGIRGIEISVGDDVEAALEIIEKADLKVS